MIGKSVIKEWEYRQSHSYYKTYEESMAGLANLIDVSIDYNKPAKSVITSKEQHICDYPICSERGSGHPLACNCKSPNPTVVEKQIINKPIDYEYINDYRTRQRELRDAGFDAYNCDEIDEFPKWG